MKRWTPFIGFILLLMIHIPDVQAQQKGIGVGAMLNGPDGLSIKGWVGEKVAIDGALSFSLGDHFSSLYIHSDVLYHNNPTKAKMPVEKGHLTPYYGGGLRLIWSDASNDATVGLRAPAGLSYTFEGSPSEAFFELVPTIDINPDLRFLFTGAIGFRYYLK